jgi:hypothetical protein
LSLHILNGYRASYHYSNTVKKKLAKIRHSLTSNSSWRIQRMKTKGNQGMNSPRAWGLGGRGGLYGRVDMSAVRHSVDCDGGWWPASRIPSIPPSIPPRRFSFCRQVAAHNLHASASVCSRISEDGARARLPVLSGIDLVIFSLILRSLRGTAASRAGRWITMSNLFCDEERCAQDYKAMAGECSLT